MKLTFHICLHGVEQEQLHLLLSVIFFLIRESIPTRHFATIFFRAKFCLHCPFTPCATCLACLTHGLTNLNVHEVHIFWSSLLCIFTAAFCYFLSDPDIFLHYLFFSEYKRPSFSPIQNYSKDLSAHLSRVRGISFLQNVVRDITLQQCLRIIGAPKMFLWGEEGY